MVEFIFLVQVFVLFPNIRFLADILSSVLIEDTNANRLDDDLPSLKTNSLLTKAAQAKAEDMAANGYFSHTSPSGITPWYWFEKAGYNYSYAGENLAIDFSDSSDVVNAWMNSSGHRQNILNGKFSDIGIGIAKGTYEARETIFIVQMFGRLTKRPASLAKETTESTQAFKLDNLKPETQEPTQPLINIISENEPEVLPTETETNIQQNSFISSFLERLVASPSIRTKYIYFGILAIIFLALILNIFIKIKIQHPHLIMNAMILIVIINSVLILNQYLVSVNGKIF